MTMARHGKMGGETAAAHPDCWACCQKKSCLLASLAVAGPGRRTQLPRLHISVSVDAIRMGRPRACICSHHSAVLDAHNLFACLWKSICKRLLAEMPLLTVIPRDTSAAPCTHLLRRGASESPQCCPPLVPGYPVVEGQRQTCSIDGACVR